MNAKGVVQVTVETFVELANEVRKKRTIKEGTKHDKRMAIPPIDFRWAIK